MNADFEPMVPEPRLPDTPTPEVPPSLTYPFWGYEDVALFFGMGLPCLVLSLAVMEGLTWLLPVKPSKGIYLLTAQFIGYVLWFATLVLLLRVRYAAPFWKSLAWIMPRRGLWASLFLGPLLTFGVGLLGLILPQVQIESPFHELMTSSKASFLLTGIFSVSIAPLCEELAFRGFLMPVLVRSLGAAPGILMAALPFALLHGPQYSWAWQYILVLFLVSTVFGIMRHITGSTAAATMTHASFNLTMFAAQIVQGM
jgi:CAAX protease family protein